MRAVLAGALTVAALGVPNRGAAQESTDPSRAWCWRGAPAPRCGAVILTNFALVVGPTAPARRPPINARWEAGVMKNVSDRLALGATTFVVHDDEGRYLAGVGPRGRWWVRPSVGIDVELGAIVRDVKRETFVVDTPSFSGTVGVTWSDRVGVVAQVEVLRVRQAPGDNPLLTGTRTTPYLGLRLGTPFGVLGGILAAALIHWANQFT